jgi:hypothetical protein
MRSLTRNTRLRVIGAKSWLLSAVVALVCVAVLPIFRAPTRAVAAEAALTANQHNPEEYAKPNYEGDLTPEQIFQKRFPQPVRVGDLIGLPVLDDGDSTIGYVKNVVRSATGKIFLIVPYSPWFGWLPTEWGKRPVAVPIEVVTILARQLDSVDMDREDFDEAPTWVPSKDQPIPPDEKIRVALGRR